MLTLEWSIKALIDLDQAQRYIAYENPTAARLVAQRVHDAARLLRSNPSMGTPAHVPDARLWVVDRTPYLIVYRVRGERLEILRLWHSRRDWQNAKS